MSLLAAPLCGLHADQNPAPGHSQAGTATGMALKEKGLKKAQLGDVQSKIWHMLLKADPMTT